MVLAKLVKLELDRKKVEIFSQQLYFKVVNFNLL